MTFVNHTIGGFAFGSALAYFLYVLFGIDLWWLMVIINALIGAFPDVGSWVFWKLWPDRWQRWQLYTYCHPPYDAVTGHGKVDRIMKWWPSWGIHTWLIDSVVHPSAPKFIFPKFPIQWQSVVWIRLWPTHWNISWTKWDVLYVLMELLLTILYIAVISFTII